MYKRSSLRRQSGLLIFTLGFTMFCLFLMLLTLALIENSRNNVILHKQKTAALYLAKSGIDFARYMIRENKLSEKDLYEFTSPVIEGSGYFRIRAEKIGYGTYRITSTGYATDRTFIVKTENLSI